MVGGDLSVQFFQQQKNDRHVTGGICVVFSSMNGKKIIYMYYTLAPEGATPVYISLTDGEKNQIS